MSYLLEVPVAGGNPIVVEVTDPNVDVTAAYDEPAVGVGEVERA
jgi:hypothetical protein